MFDAVFQVAPDLARHLVGGGDPPAAFVFEVGGFEDVDQPQFRFAPASSASECLEAGGAFEDLHLPRVGHYALDGRRQIRCGWVGVVAGPFPAFQSRPPVAWYG